MTAPKVRVRHVSRERDEEVLQMLAWRRAGRSVTWIEQRLGIAHGIATTATRKVMLADLEESGEPPGIVRAGYW